MTVTATLLGVSLTATGTAAQGAALSPPEGADQRPSGHHLVPALIDAGPHHRSWRPAAPGRRPDEQTQAAESYLELASGLNRWDPKRESWQPAEAVFERHHQGYFLARSTQHQVILAPDLNVRVAVDLLAPDGVRLRSTILGLALLDAASGQSVLVAEVKSCQGAQLSPTEIVYRDAFDGLVADVRYLITLDRFEQDVILRERIPPEAISDLGLDPYHTRLLVLTEFFDPPHPSKKVRHLPRPEGSPLADEELSFGAMAMGAGQASALGNVPPGIPVHKSWEALEGRQLLIEAVPYPALLAVSGTLPTASRERFESLKARVRRTAQVEHPGAASPASEAELQLPGPRQAHHRPIGWQTDEPGVRPSGQSTAQTSVSTGAGLLADGVVIDYALILAPVTSDLTFRGDTTYHISGPFSVSGIATFEGGCVIKFAPSASASLQLHGPVRCQTAPYRPAILTARDDNTIGAPIANSTGNPTSRYYGQPALQIMRSGQTLHDLRIAHAQTGLFFHDYSAGSNSVRHVQFVRCGTALRINGYGVQFQNVVLHNVLIHGAAQALAGYSFRAVGEHLTLCQANQLTADTEGLLYGTRSSVSLLNSLLVAVPSLGNVFVTQNVCRWASHSNEVFRTVGAGGFYLATSAHINAGTTNINPALARELKLKTTAPPLVRTASSSSDLVFAPVVACDLDQPDLGYHYDPIDLAVSGLTIPGGRTLTVLRDACLTTFGAFGIRLDPAARLRAEGDPLRPVRMVRYSLVQEQSLVWGGVTPNPVSIGGNAQSVSTAPTAPSATFRYTEFCAAAGGGHHLRSDASTSRFRTISLQDCLVRGGEYELSGDSSTVVSLRNSLFESTVVTLGSSMQMTVFNNLFRGGVLQLERAGMAGNWTIRDTAFHDLDLRDLSGGILHSHNAYLGPHQKSLNGGTSGNITLASFPYLAGPLGGYYHGVTNLVNAGSQAAGNAGLYHHTVQTEQAKETNSVVDIGFHYVAVSAGQTASQPQDADGDGSADYLEDANGNGTVDSVETDWRDARDLGLGIRITRPQRASPVP